MELVLALLFFLQFLVQRSDTVTLVSDVRFLLAPLHHKILAKLLLNHCFSLLKFISCCTILRDAASLHVKLRLLLFPEGFQSNLDSRLNLILQIINYRLNASQDRIMVTKYLRGIAFIIIVVLFLHVVKYIIDLWHLLSLSHVDGCSTVLLLDILRNRYLPLLPWHVSERLCAITRGARLLCR